MYLQNYFKFFNHRKELPIYVRECVDCYTRPWKIVEFAQRNYSSSCFARERFERGVISPSIYQQEFEIDRDFFTFEDNLIYKVNY